MQIHSRENNFETMAKEKIENRHHHDPQLVMAASIELEEMKSSLASPQNIAPGISLGFPPRCRKLLNFIPGNRNCVDCGNSNPQWASVTHGTLHCLSCAGNHRGLGVKTSFVRSLDMDDWSCSQILSMMEGGNTQLSNFFERRSLPSISTTTKTSIQKSMIDRYLTNAAQRYRKRLGEHVGSISDGDEAYQGRGAYARRRRKGGRDRETGARKVNEPINYKEVRKNVSLSRVGSRRRKNNGKNLLQPSEILLVA